MVSTLIVPQPLTGFTSGFFGKDEIPWGGGTVPLLIALDCYVDWEVAGIVPVLCGLPQGSVIVPFLFLLLVNGAFEDLTLFGANGVKNSNPPGFRNL